MKIGDKVIFEGVVFFIEDIIIQNNVVYVQISNNSHRARVNQKYLKKSY